MIGMWLKDLLVSVIIKRQIGCVKMISSTFLRDSRVRNATIKRIIGCVRISNIMFLKDLHALNAIIKKETGIVIIVIGTHQ